MAGAVPDTILRTPRSNLGGAAGAGGFFSPRSAAARATASRLRQEQANHHHHQYQYQNQAHRFQQRDQPQPPAVSSFNFDFSIPASPASARLSQLNLSDSPTYYPQGATASSRSDAYRSTDLRHQSAPFEPGQSRALPALPLNDGALHNRNQQQQQQQQNHQLADSLIFAASKRPHAPAHLGSCDSIETHINKRRQTLTDADKPSPVVAAVQHRPVQQSPRRDGVGTSPRTRANFDRRRRLSAATAALRTADPAQPAQPSIPSREFTFLSTPSRQLATNYTAPPETTADAQQSQSSARPASLATTVHSASSGAASATSRLGLSLAPHESIEAAAPPPPTRPEQRRAPGSSLFDGIDFQSSFDASKQIRPSIESDFDSRLAEDSQPDPALNRRDLLPLKTVQRSMSDDKRSSFTRRPPVSYKPPVGSGANTPTANSTVVPPIRGFRSSSQRRSLTLDMPSPRTFDNGEDYLDSNPRDQSLRALEGRSDEQTSAVTPSDSVPADLDDSGDVFLRIARQEPGPSDDEGRRYGDSRSDSSRPTRTARRPMSAAVNTYEPASPPRLTRRMSEHEGARSRDPSVDVGNERLGRQSSVMQRGLSRERTGEDARARSIAPGLRSSPMTPRMLTFQDSVSLSADSVSPQSRRRQHSVDTSYAAGTRVSALKQSGSVVGQARNYNSSPLASKTAPDPQAEASNAVEGTSSTGSTGGPSTVWDELEDLKSRLHRLELTGKLPQTSGAAISRATEERPPTANTNATTMSASPKRNNVAQTQASDAVSTTSSSHQIRQESHPVLHNALAKSRSLLTPEVYSALEAAAKDALSLANLMGTSGQPGPISSAASGVGAGLAVTDRQLRRKADSICRSITELCIALSDVTPETKADPVPISASPNKSPMASPTVTRFTGLASHSRKPSTLADRAAVLSATSPRASSRLEDKRTSVLMNSALPSPRHSNPPVTLSAIEASAAGRKSSLLFSRTRRAQTEEPEDPRHSSLLRTHRAGTEEMEDGGERRSSMLVRGRRGGTEEPEEAGMRRPSLLARSRRKTMEADEDLPQLRTPSRAITEVAGVRSPREYHTNQQTSSREEGLALASSPLPKRQLTTSSIASRIVQPTPPSTMVSRRFLERSTERERAAAARDVQFDFEREEMPPRRMSLAQPSSLTRAPSLTRRTTRESMIALPTSATGTRTNGFR